MIGLYKNLKRNPLRIFSYIYGWLVGLIYIDQTSGRLPLVYDTPGLRIKFRKKGNGKIIINGRLIIEKHGAQPPYGNIVIGVNPDAALIINGTVILGASTNLLVGKGATMILGNRPDGILSFAYNTHIIANELVEVGSGGLFSWDTLIMDTNYHHITKPTTSNNKPVKIGEHVWVGAKAMILKGVEIGDGSIVAASSVVTKNVPPKTMAGGNPAIIIKHDVEWSE